MIVCDYCGRNCNHDHAEYKVEAYRWDYNGYQYGAHNTFHLHRWCYEELIAGIYKMREQQERMAMVKGM